MVQNGYQFAETDEQSHDSAVALTGQSGKDDEGDKREGMFLCTFENHWVPKTDAAKKGDNPSICRACSAKKREQSRQREEEERAQKLASIDQIPLLEQRGGSKRVTYTLSKYTATALEVLAVGKTTSEVVERAVIQYLQQEDPQVIAFVGRLFQHEKSK